ncbi:MAG: hypothetical protein K2X00_11560 [Nitrospiraceae bacterium]|nr:hypothetical protein [Nitrospiraceae bacterium]OQW65070.1 MAG: hypothetical protein BVN29_10890 [Nitrospira sp. ST-bin5]
MLRALLVSLLATALIGGLLYYTLKRSDVVQGQLREAQANQAAQQEAAAVSRAFAAMSAAALVVDVARVQESLAGSWRTSGLADAMVIDHGNRVFAASNAGYVGQQIQDANWAAIRAQNREVLIRDEPTPGQERITVIEPIQDKGSTIAWARLTFMRPIQQDAGRSPQERLEQIGRIMIPVFVFLVAAIGFAMRLATSRMQRRIQAVVTEVMTDQPASQDDEISFGDGAVRPDGGSRKAA